jgi:ABC-type nitrate/sulfonate/bicarbonate transport system permease component
VIARRLLGVFVLALALGVWEVWARAYPSFLLPPFSDVARDAWQVWPTRDFFATVASSLRRFASVGIVVGVVLGASGAVRRTIEPFAEFLRATPPIAIVPVAIVILGLGDGMRIAVIAFGVCFPVLVSAADGVRAVSPEARDTAAMLQVGAVERLYRLYLPAALPSIVAGMRVALSIGLVMVIISEFVGAPNGLGHYLTSEQSQFDMPGLYGGILFLGLLGYVLNQLFLVAERRVLAWHYGATGDLGR